MRKDHPRRRKTFQFKVYVEPTLAKAFDEVARRTGESRSVVVRQFMRRFARKAGAA